MISDVGSDRRYFWLLFFAIFPLYLTWTFDHSLWNPDETRDAGIAREMYVTKNLVTPHLNGEAFLEKPPLYYWSCSAIYKLTGGISDGRTRLPAALFGFLGILFTFLIGRKLFDARTGFIAAAIVATAAQYFRMSHFALMDSSLAALLTGAFYFYVTSQTLLFVLFVTFAFYTKGFVAVALAGLVIGVDLVVQKNFKRLAAISAVGTVVFAVFVAPWVHALWKQGGQDFLRVFFIDNNWKRFVANGTDHVEPIYFYFGSFPVDFLPWTFFFAAAIFFQLKKNFSLRSKFPAIWFLAIFIFLSLSSSKRSMYLLPIFPAAALWCAPWIASRPNAYKWFVRVFTTMCALIIAGDLIFIRKLDRDKTFVPVVTEIKNRAADKTLAAFDLSEMERGVFPFYLERTIPNLKTTQDLENWIKETPNGVLLTNRNKLAILNPILDEKMDKVFTYRENKSTRSYVIFETKKEPKKVP